MPLLSVVIPTYNRSKLIEKAVRSVLAQTEQDFEIVIVDDSSTDDTPAVVATLVEKNQPIRFLQHDTNRGPQAARNTGIRAAQGEWIAFLDSDDQWLPYSLEARLDVAKREGVSVVHSECYVISEDGDLAFFGVPAMAGWIYRDVLIRPGPVFPGLMVARRALEKIGHLDEHIVSYQEWDTAIRLAKHYQFGFSARPTFVYDCQGTDTISKDMLRNASGFEQVFRKHALAILRSTGPRVLARHYRAAASRYVKGGDLHSARRCKIMAFLWWPFDARPMVRQFQRHRPF